MTNTAETQRDAIREELRRLEESAMWASQAQFEQTKIWRGVNLTLGLPASVVAAISGATALAAETGRVVAGILALAAAGFGAILTTVNAGHRMNQASAAANAYLEIQTAARQAREVDLPEMPIENARQLLAELTARRDEQNKTAEVPTRRAYNRAKKNIEKDQGQTYKADTNQQNKGKEIA